MALVPFGEFLPDQPDFQNPGATTILNVLPRTAKSYGPIGSLSTTLNALGARCQGAIGVRDNAGGASDFAGTASKLYLANSALTSWSDVSVSGGYATDAAERWSFTLYGNDCIATNFANPVQVYTLGSSTTFTNLSTGAPKARYCAVAKDFLFLGNVNDSTDGERPQRIHWSAIGDDTNWPALGSGTAVEVQSDAQDIVGDHGWLTGLVSSISGVDLAIFFERLVVQGTYIGAPDIWGFYPIHGVRGCVIPGSLQAVEGGCIYVGADGFYLFDGQRSIPIGYQKIDKTFYGDVDQSNLFRCCSVVDPINKIYFFAYPSTLSNGTPDTILACNYLLPSVVGTPGRWSKITGISVETLFRSVSFGYTMDTLDNTGFTMDTLPFSLDSRVWTGNALDLLTAFDTTHTMALFNGSALAPTVETSETEFVEGQRSSIVATRPIIDGGTPTVTPYTRSKPTDTPTARTASVMTNDGYCFHKDAEGRLTRFRMTLPAGTTYTHLQGIDIDPDDVSASGER